MKGEAENTIVRIIIALIIIGVIVALIYLSLGPFRKEINANICYAALKSYCADKLPTDTISNTVITSSCNRDLPESKDYLKSVQTCEQIE